MGNGWDFKIHGGIILLNIIIETIPIHANYGSLKHMNKVRLGLDYDHIYILQSRRLAYKWGPIETPKPTTPTWADNVCLKQSENEI